MSKSIYILYLLIAIASMACSPKQSKNITNGTYISAIQEGVIKDKDGEKFIIEDSISYSTIKKNISPFVEK